jgi:hypothetical protein
MHWIEIIHLQVAGGDRIRQVWEIVEGLPLEARAEGLRGIEIYRHGVFETDMGIHLCWDSAKAAVDGSPLALRIVDALSDFGLVHHGVWIEQPIGMDRIYIKGGG